MTTQKMRFFGIKKSSAFLANKKGIAPLIATVLLVAFAVAIAAIVMDWNRNYVQDTSDTARIESELKVTCNLNLGLGIEDVHGEQQICFVNETERIKVVLENSRRTKIEDVQIRVSTNESVYGPYSLDSVHSVDGMLPIEGGEAVVAYLNITEPAGSNETIEGNIEKVTFFPGIEVENKIRLCVESSINVEGPLEECE